MVIGLLANQVEFGLGIHAWSQVSPTISYTKVLIMIIRLDNLLWENIVTLSHYPLPSNKMGFDGPLILRSLNNASASTCINLLHKKHKPGIRTQTRNLKSHRLMKKEILIMADTNKRRLKPELESLQVYGDTLVGWDENAPPNWIRGPMWRQCVKRVRMTLSPYRLGIESGRSRNMIQLTWSSFPTRFWTRLFTTAVSRT